MAKAMAQARLAAVRRKAACSKKSNGISARRNDHVCAGFPIRSAWGPRHEGMLSRSTRDQSNWRMDQCAIHMDGARTMLHRLWQTCCPFLPQLAT
ncbi:hypothetical protein ACVWWP_002872 [Bradyrhizobium sp. LM3.6]